MNVKSNTLPLSLYTGSYDRAWSITPYGDILKKHFAYIYSSALDHLKVYNSYRDFKLQMGGNCSSLFVNHCADQVLLSHFHSFEAGIASAIFSLKL